jgi:hypothetical protein
MADSYRTTPQSAPPETESSGTNTPTEHPQPLPPAPPPATTDEPDELTFDSLPKRAIDDPQNTAANEQDQEADRQVWRPPVPQYPARPERQAPVQYEAPRVQQAPPQYAQQQYTPPQPSTPPAPQAQPQPQPQAYPQMYAQQPSYAATAPVTYVPPRPAIVVAPPAPKVSTARMGRRMARRTVMGVSAAGKKIFGARPGLMVAFLLVLVFSGWMAYDKWFTSSSSSSATPNAPNAPNASGMIPLPPEVPAVQAYLTASAKDDADGVWDTLSPAEKANRITNGEDKTVLTAVLDAQKQYSLTTKYRYVGGMGPNGSTDLSHGGYYFYVQDVTSGTQQKSFPMYFSVDDQGKITTVSDQLYKLILQQLKGGN